MKEYGLPLARLDCQEAELLPTREALGDFVINNIININFAIAVAGIADQVSAVAGQFVSIGD